MPFQASGPTVSAGVAFTTKLNLLPKAALLAMDAGFVDFEFQFPPMSFTENEAAIYGESSSLSRDDPIQQWLKGDLKTITFNAMFYAGHAAQDLGDYLAYIKRMNKKDDALGRPPIWNFVYGTIIDEIVVVESIGGITYGELRSNLNVGSVRDVYLSVTLRKYTPYDVQLVDPNAPPSDTFYALVKDGDTWEHLAGREYNKPSMGDILRQRNPDKVVPAAGQQVLLPDFVNIRSEVPRPSSIPLRRLADRMALRQQIFALRGIARYSAVL